MSQTCRSWHKSGPFGRHWRCTKPRGHDTQHEDAKGETWGAAPRTATAGKVIDLMAALKASLARV